MDIKNYNRPWLFYGLATLIPWSCWFVTAYLSRLTPAQPAYNTWGAVIAIAGLTAPAIVAFVLMGFNQQLRRDLVQRMTGFKGVKPFYLLLTFGLMPASILLAQAVSLLFGYGIEQFSFSDNFSFSFSLGFFPPWFLLLLAPLLEELAWHSYGTDCLRARFSLFSTSLIFALFWALWHIPLAFIKGYYHANVAESGVLYSVNFMVSILPFVMIMNWLYYKSGRNIGVTVIFHITAGFFNELFSTHPMSKVIQTGLLLLLTGWLLYRERELFFTKQV